MTEQRCLHDLPAAQCGYCNPALVAPKAAPRGRPALRPAWAAQVFDLIPVDGSRVTATQLAERSGLDVQQVYAAVAELREAYPDWPLLSGHDGYGFDMDEDRTAAFRQWRARCALTVIRRLWRGAVKPYTERSDPAQAKTVTRQFERLLEDLADVTGL